jgi:hypothetical protein
MDLAFNFAINDNVSPSNVSPHAGLRTNSYISSGVTDDAFKIAFHHQILSPGILAAKLRSPA